jgi:rhodanese-related sulfurtransferase
MMSSSKSYLLDVRSPSEFQSGALPGAQNIEYQSVPLFIIDQENAPKDSPITLYCRSGRRSAIAKNALNELGYVNVRDLGDLESAREVLSREGGQGKDEVGEGRGKSVDAGRLRESTNALLEGLKGLD